MSGDYELEDTVYIPFSTRAFASGIPTALVSGEVQIYEDASITQITAAETLTVSLDGIAGFNMVAVAATAANGFGVGQSYTLILSAGTVASVSVVGEVVGHFTIEMSAAHLRLGAPAGASVSADLVVIDNFVDGLETTIGTAGAGLTNLGASGNDWNTVVPDAAGVAPTAAEIETEIWDALQSAHVVPASMGIIASEIATIDGKVDTAQLDLDTITGTAGVLIGTDAANVTEISDAVWDEDATGHQTQGTFGQAIGDPAADATTIYQAVATDATGDNVAIDVVAVKAETALIVADTNELQTDNVPGLIATAQADLDVITGATGVNLLNATQASIDAIEVDTGTTLDAALAVVDANVDTMVAGLVTGAFEGTPTTTVMQTNLAEATDNHYNGAVLIITSGNGLDQRTDITDYTGATGTLTVTAVATAPVATDTFKIV